MTATRQQVLDWARSKLGTLERTGRNDVEFADDWGITGYAWCFAFVQSAFWYTNARLPLISMYCPTGVAYARANGQAIEVGEGSPLPGDVVFYCWDGVRHRNGEVGDHVGIVESSTATTVTAIEGNTSNGPHQRDGVYRMTRGLTQVACFWRPPVFTDDDPFAPAAVLEEDVLNNDDKVFIQQVIGQVGDNLRSALAADVRTLLAQQPPTPAGDVHVDVDKLGAAIGRSLLAGVLKP